MLLKLAYCRVLLNFQRVLQNCSLKRDHETTGETQCILINLDICRHSNTKTNIYGKMKICTTLVFDRRNNVWNVSVPMAAHRTVW